MNERIKELNRAAQAYAGKLVGNDEDSNFSLWVEIYKEKLAELLLQECVDACWRANKISYSVPPTQQQVALDCVREIETALRS